MGKILVCDYCGTVFNLEDDAVCPNCGTLSAHPKEDE